MTTPEIKITITIIPRIRSNSKERKGMKSLPIPIGPNPAESVHLRRPRAPNSAGRLAARTSTTPAASTPAFIRPIHAFRCCRSHPSSRSSSRWPLLLCSDGAVE
ncbi:hypothetical protein Dimus_030413, partial [Dionaea muscipula]